MLMFNLSSVFVLSILVFSNISGTIAQAFKNEVFKFADFLQPRIVNGTLAELEATRHQVSIRKKLKDKRKFGSGHICGGSLISENVVLTAAHCVLNYQSAESTFYPPSHFIAVMGDLDRSKMSNNTLVFNIIKVVTFAATFNRTTFKNDIALLILNGKVPAKHPTLTPIMLNDSPVESNTLCQASGWGDTGYGFESEVLLTVDVPIITADDCREKTPLKSLIIEGMFCAGYMEGEKDSCAGDSGGALVCAGVQAGIISWGNGCAVPLFPGVLTDVAFHKDWILQQTSNHNGTLPRFASSTRNDTGNSDGGDVGGSDGGGLGGSDGGGLGGSDGGDVGGSDGGDVGGTNGGDVGGTNGGDVGGSDGGDVGGSDGGGVGGTIDGDVGGSYGGGVGGTIDGDVGGSYGSDVGGSNGGGVPNLNCTLMLISLIYIYGNLKFLFKPNEIN